MLPRQGPPFFTGRRAMPYRGAPRPFGAPTPFGPSRMRQPRGGLLSKLLNRSSRSAAGIPKGVTGFERQAAQVGKAASSGGLQQFLANTQQVLNTVQQAGPIIQQYGPLVRNLPSMWNLYKGLKSLPDASEGEAADTIESPDLSEKKHEDYRKNSKKASEQPVGKESKSRGSVPKLYI